jgi:serine phosphatase RsbU (regulator of sigma subunit)
MRILVGWDDAAEADLISLYLNVDQNEARVTTNPAEFCELAERENWDVGLMALTFPDAERGLATFERARVLLVDTPIIAACRPLEVYQLASFVAGGLHSHIMRDTSGDYIFLLMPTVQAAFDAVTAERSRKLADRLRQEIESVRRLQESVIPRNIQAPKGYSVAARYEPSQIQVFGSRPVVLAGGDYYDVFSMKENELVLLVGDASGHGMKACMSIMTMHTLIRMIRENLYNNTADFVTQVNRRLCEHDIIQDEGGFITLLYCALNTDTHTLEWTSAGHQVPLLQNLKTNEIVPLGSEDEGGLPLGISLDLPYDVKRNQIPANHRLLLYSDGLAEAFPEGGDQHDEFGTDGIIGALQAAAELPLEQALDTLFIASHEFTGGSGRHDDTSVVLLERKA